MKNIMILLVLALCLMTRSASAQMLSKGVSKELADHRKANISKIVYDLSFDIPADPHEKVKGKAIISFDLKAPQDVVLDFQGDFDGSCYTYIEKKKGKAKRMPIEATYHDEHIILPMASMREGSNKIELHFESQDKALNRNADYMYTLFVPDMARSVFPCFDQPDLRAVFVTSLKVPNGWKTMTSDNICQLPTYLYSFVAGNFQEKTSVCEGRPMRILYRETNPDKVAQLDQVFEEAAQALKWMEGYTGIACPFKEYGMVVLPGYQFGGMEHPGAIQMNDRRIFLEKNATQEEQAARLELIAHETAHLWFGDLVSLKWFEDVWAKEVLANFMASKITRRSFSKINHELNFLKTYQSRAIAIDRTDGTHPIAQELGNLNHASLLYDNIIYDKAPVMMRMLEEVMGAPEMQTGLQRYLRDNLFGNASWDDLVAALDSAAPSAHVRQFSDVWVRQKGMPTIHTAYKDGSIVITQTDPYHRGIVWPQKFQVRLIYELGTSRTVNVDMKDPTVTIKVTGKPNYIIPNYDGKGYGHFTLDDEYAVILPKRLITTRNDLNRYALLLTIHDNYLLGRVPPSHFGELYRFMMKERNPLIMSTAVDHMFKIAFDLAPSQRKTLELCMMDLLGENRTKECRQYVIRKLGSNATAPELLDRIYTIWQQHNDPLFSEHDYMDMAYRLAIVRGDTYHPVLAAQRKRLKTADEQREFDYVSRVCTPDPALRTRLFNEMLRPQNREQEPWALKALRLLCSDVYEPVSNALIEPGLQSLQYIQQTSDIFFPTSWLQAMLASHKSKEARLIVEQFISAHPDYPEHLRNKIFEAAWMLMKQQTYVTKAQPVVVQKKKPLAPAKKAAAKKAPAKKK
jgi:aminopeptidase N